MGVGGWKAVGIGAVTCYGVNKVMPGTITLDKAKSLCCNKMTAAIASGAGQTLVSATEGLVKTGIDLATQEGAPATTPPDKTTASESKAEDPSKASKKPSVQWKTGSQSPKKSSEADESGHELWIIGGVVFIILAVVVGFYLKHKCDKKKQQTPTAFEYNLDKPYGPKAGKYGDYSGAYGSEDKKTFDDFAAGFG